MLPPTSARRSGRLASISHRGRGKIATCSTSGTEARSGSGAARALIDSTFWPPNRDRRALPGNSVTQDNEAISIIETSGCRSASLRLSAGELSLHPRLAIGPVPKTALLAITRPYAASRVGRHPSQGHSNEASACPLLPVPSRWRTFVRAAPLTGAVGRKAPAAPPTSADTP